MSWDTRRDWTGPAVQEHAFSSEFSWGPETAQKIAGALIVWRCPQKIWLPRKIIHFFKRIFQPFPDIPMFTWVGWFHDDGTPEVSSMHVRHWTLWGAASEAESREETFRRGRTMAGTWPGWKSLVNGRECKGNHLQVTLLQVSYYCLYSDVSGKTADRTLATCENMCCSRLVLALSLHRLAMRVLHASREKNAI